MEFETDSLVLEHLRAMRADNAAIRSPQGDLRREMQDGFARVGERISRLETEVRGLSYILSTGVGAVVVDTKGLKPRAGLLEERAEQPV